MDRPVPPDYLGEMQTLKPHALLLIGVLVFGAPAVGYAQIREAGPSPSKTPILDELRRKHLLFPVAGTTVDLLRDTFRDPRGEDRVHYALDIPAPRGTPVLSTDSGYVVKLYRGKAGGVVVYAADADERFIYYYAHLDRYREGLQEGMPLARGDTIGYVGTTGNAPPNYPHLHFAILKSNDVKRWSKGLPVNPFKVFSSQ